MKRGGNKEILLVSNGDLRLSANQNCWELKSLMECNLAKKQCLINSQNVQ